MVYKHTKKRKMYYDQVIQIHKETGYGKRRIAKVFPAVQESTIGVWIANFKAENGIGSPKRIMEAKKAKEQEELEVLKAQIADLEEQLRVEKLRNRLNEKIIDIAESRWHIEIRKKAGTKQ